MSTLKKGFEKLEKLFMTVSVATLFIMMVWIFIDVILRYFFNSPIPGTMELTGEYFMVLIIFLSISYTHKHNGHVRVELLEEKLPKKLKSLSTICTNIIVLAILSLILKANINASLDNFARDIRSVGALEYPIGPAFIIIALGIFMISCRILLQTAELFSSSRGNHNEIVINNGENSVRKSG